MSFVFYDTETTGMNWAFDQILQFAAVRTNADLDPVAELNLESRLLPHVVPSAEANHRPCDFQKRCGLDRSRA